MKVDGTRVEDLAGTGLTTRQRYVIPLWASTTVLWARWVLRALAWVLVRVVRAWGVTGPTALVLLARVWGGPTAGVVVAASGTVGLVVWACWFPGSFSRVVVRRVRGRWRWWSRYARAWHAGMDGTGLTRRTPTGDLYTPRVARIRSGRVVDEIDLRLLHGQTPAEVARAAEGLRHVFAAYRCAVRELGPGRVRVSFYTRDPLTALVPVADPAPVPDLTALPVGLTESGQAYRLRLAGTHLLIAGATGSGKGSVLWAVLRSLAPHIAGGTVTVTGLDPKGGMELHPARPIFTHYADQDPETLVEALEDAAGRMNTRKKQMRATGRRSFTPGPGDPWELIMIDELAVLTAYTPAKTLRDRARTALSLLLTQGRAPGFIVIAALQDPRKEVLPFRDLFSTRIALRLSESTHTDMVLGDGATDHGAACHLIPEHLPGTGYARVEGRAEPVRVRFPHTGDNALNELATRWPAPTHHTTRNGQDTPDNNETRTGERTDGAEGAGVLDLRGGCEDQTGTRSRPGRRVPRQRDTQRGTEHTP